MNIPKANSSRNGFIKLWYGLNDWEWADDPHTLALWIHLLLAASWQDKEWKGHTIKRGQIVFGRKQWAEKTGLSEQQIRTCLTKLKSTSNITITSTSKFSLLTIVNYEKYQSTEKNQPANQPASQPVINQQVNHILRLEDCEEGKTSKYTPLPPKGGDVSVADFDSVVETPVKKKPRKQKPPEAPLVIPEFIPETALNAFFANRASMKKPMTAHAKELLINKITELYHKGHDPTKLLERAILSGWLTVYESNDTLTDGVKNAPFQQSNGRNHSQSKPSFQQEWDKQREINLEFIANLKRKAAAEERAAEMGTKS